MNCMKCGKETVENRIFCDECLADMDAHPVRPGTVVLLPQRQTTPKKGQPAKKTRTPEEQMTRLKKLCKGLAIGVLTVVLLSALTITLLVNRLMNLQQQLEDDIGRNYNTVNDE